MNPLFYYSTTIIFLGLYPTISQAAHHYPLPTDHQCTHHQPKTSLHDRNLLDDRLR